MMKKVKLTLLITISLSLAACERNNDSSNDAKPGYWAKALPITTDGNSLVYPNGLMARKHRNSISVNTSPPFSSTNSLIIGNSGLDNGISDVKRPDYANPDTYENKIYFNSNASDGGDGTMDRPYNNISGLTDGSMLAEKTAYLFKAGSIFMMSGIQQDYNNTRSTMYFGAYGEGTMPIISNTNDFKNPTEEKGGFWLYGKNIALDGIHIVARSNDPYSVLLKMDGSDIMIANCHIESIKNDNGRYVFFGIKGGVDNLTIYNTEFAFVACDMFYLSANYSGYQFISNYFHHCNMESYSDPSFDPENRDTWLYKTGDIIQFEDGTPKRSYFANNIFDRGDSPSKFCFIINGATPLDNIDGTTIEYNTFITPLTSKNGGAGCYLYSYVFLNNNLFVNTDPEGAMPAIATSPSYGANYENNHFVNYNGSETYSVKMSELGEGNSTYSDLETYISRVPLENRSGSSLY